MKAFVFRTLTIDGQTIRTAVRPGKPHFCDVIALLPNWTDSEGAKEEKRIAELVGMTVVNAHDLVSMEIAG